MEIIEVTELDIRNGRLGDVHTNPVALALRRRFPNTYIEAAYDYVQIGKHYYATNQQIKDFIMLCVSDRSLRPFSFDLDSLHENRFLLLLKLWNKAFYFWLCGGILPIVGSE